MEIYFQLLQTNWYWLLAGIALGGLLVYFGQRLIRGRASIVRLVKVNESALLNLAQTARPDLEVQFKGKSIRQLYVSTFTLQNLDDQVLDNVCVEMTFTQPVLLELTLLDSLAPARESQAVLVDSETIRVTLPYLNPGLFLKDEVQFQIMATQAPKIAKLTGGGRGWAVGFVDRVAILNEIFREIGRIDPTQFVSRPINATVITVVVFWRIFPKLRRLLFV